MRVELPILSFICSAFLLFLIFISLKRSRINVPNASIAICLFVCSVIHGIDALVWAGNVVIRIPVWCDIATKLLLGSTVAIGAACLCSSRHLEFVSSTRNVPTGTHFKRNRKIIDIALCCIPPSVYIALHPIAQDHRFDLVQDYGCSASVNPSTPALIVIWLPPAMICIVSLIFSGRAVHNMFRLPGFRFSTHLDTRTSMTSSHFVRQLCINIIILVSLGVFILFSFFSYSLLPWISWASAHAQFYDINVVTSRSDSRTVDLFWWGITVISIIYILVAAALGQEIRDFFKSTKDYRSKPLKSNFRSILPMHRKRQGPVMRSTSFNVPQAQSQAIELKSGWDDTFKSSSIKTEAKGKSYTPSTSPSSSNESSSTSPEDDAFIASTLTYLESPIAQTLGLHKPLISPPPIYTSPLKPTFDYALAGLSPKRIEPLALTPRSDVFQPIPEDAKSTISSIWEAPWPIPPATVPAIPPSPSRSRAHNKTRPRSPSSSEDPFEYPSYSTPEARPFQGPGISPLSSTIAIPDIRTEEHVARSPSTIRRSLRRALSREAISRAYAAQEVIYMTVVKETYGS